MTTTTATLRRNRRTARATDVTVDQIAGRVATVTTYDGDVLVGTVEAPAAGDLPILRLADGRWIRLSDTITLADQ